MMNQRVETLVEQRNLYGPSAQPYSLLASTTGAASPPSVLVPPESLTLRPPVLSPPQMKIPMPDVMFQQMKTAQTCQIHNQSPITYTNASLKPCTYVSSPSASWSIPQEQNQRPMVTAAPGAMVRYHNGAETGMKCCCSYMHHSPCSFCKPTPFSLPAGGPVRCSPLLGLPGEPLRMPQMESCCSPLHPGGDGQSNMLPSDHNYFRFTPNPAPLRFPTYGELLRFHHPKEQISKIMHKL